MKSRIGKIAVIALVVLAPLLFVAATLAEGMFPLSEINKINLKKAGLKIKTTEVYNPNATSLVDALVQVGGCTGSFVSGEGLIITNHHCAFSSAAGASTPENDYITNGFLAADRSKEIRTPLTCRITASYLDVSVKVLAGTENATDADARAKIIAQNIKTITKEEQTANPGLEIEISEMFIGKAYTLFRYQQIKDVRLVYIPQRSIGEFGGESDNWVWPRHNGDFAFLRAYVGADGKPATYAATNVAYQPKKFLKVNPAGVKENDFVFILGYPGRTFRHRPAKFLEHQNEYVLPTVSDWYDFQIEEAKKLSAKDKSVEIALSSMIKSRANVTKNYKGKLTGLERTSIIGDRIAQEEGMKKMIDADPALKTRYGTLFADIDAVYNQIFATYKRDFYITQLSNTSGAFYLASFIAHHRNAIKDLTQADKDKYMKDVFPRQRELLEKHHTITNKELDKILMQKLLTLCYELPQGQKIPTVQKAFTNPEAIASEVEKLNALNFFDQKKILEMFDNNPMALLQINSPIIDIAAEVFPMYSDYVVRNEEQTNRLTELAAKLLEVKQMYTKGNFIPDANSTLRFTYGNVKGYWPNDGEYNAPFTTIKGILEKAKNTGDYYLENTIKELMKRANQTAIVCFLYNLDTTGGNSGSPIMDAKGQLVGVNFDRANSACINDYAWNEAYSRSIGVDIRYILYVLKDIAKAPHLISEMGVKG